MNVGSKRRRVRWYAAMTGGLVGFAGMAALSGMPSVVPVAEKAVAHAEVAGKKVAGKKVASQKKAGDAGSQERSIEVGCSSGELIAALVRANGDGRGTLVLSEGCVYTLTAHIGADGLPVIVGSITIKGNGATLVRAANAEQFRILNVGFGGSLSLRDVTVKGGFAEEPLGGGGLVVQRGGKATIQHVVFAFNQANGPGGAFANHGVTRIVGGSEPSKDDKGKDDKGKDDKGKDDKGKDGRDGRNGGTDLLSEGFSRPWVEDAWSEDDWANGGDGEDAMVTYIEHNSALGSGGGIFNTGDLSMSHTRISYNTARGDAGGLLNFGGTAEATDTSIDHNRAGNEGGGISTVVDLAGRAATTTLRHILVADNTSNDMGGGINDDGSNLYLLHSIVRGNNAATSGGGFVNAQGKVTVDDSKLDENTSGGDAGGVTNSGTFVIRRSEVNLNSAVGAAAVAGGILTSDGGLSLSRTRVIGNLASAPAGGIVETGGSVTVDDESPIVKNRPTNCVGSQLPVPNCFG